MKKILVFLLIAAVCGCATINAGEDFQDITPGISQQELISIIGEYPVSRAHQKGNDILYYHAYVATPTNVKVFYFTFQENTLIEWGEDGTPTNREVNTHLHTVIPMSSGK